MNDVEKAFGHPFCQTEEIKEKIKFAERHIPRLKRIADNTKDKEFVGFIQMLLDSFMMHECGLGRSE